MFTFSFGNSPIPIPGIDEALISKSFSSKIREREIFLPNCILKTKTPKHEKNLCYDSQESIKFATEFRTFTLKEQTSLKFDPHDPNFPRSTVSSKFSPKIQKSNTACGSLFIPNSTIETFPSYSDSFIKLKVEPNDFHSTIQNSPYVTFGNSWKIETTLKLLVIEKLERKLIRMEKPYRKNVGMVVFNSRGEVLVGERSNFPGSWQFPQGGIDEAEDPTTAALRELYEEVGIDSGKIIAEYPDWIPYDFPENLPLNRHLQKYKGQIQKWFLIHWNGEINDCKLDIYEREFETVRFIPIENTLATAVPFKKDVYYKIVEEFGPKIHTFLQEAKKKL
ncbi:NUDIX domain protein [Leptospira santarosai str. HAI1380]|nr:NUDIX domain protein [Leptospira santarosai str. HAI1380]